MPETGVQHMGQFSIIPPARFSFPYNSNNNNNTFYTNDAAVRQRRFVYPTATSLDSLATPINATVTPAAPAPPRTYDGCIIIII